MEVEKSSLGLLASFANLIGAPEAALRVLISILLGYPIAVFHSKYLFQQTAVVKHVFFMLTGIATGYFNFGWNILHSVGCVVVQFLLLKILGGSRSCLSVSFIFNMLYLLCGYYQTGTDGYDITWSMPHCVLTLRLIGLAFDHYDGQKKPDQLSAHQKLMALPQAPSLLEMCGHVYFPGGFLVGPQFSMRRYLDFVERKYEKECGSLSDCIRPGLIRAFLGVVYLIVYQVASNFISDYYVTSQDFFELSFLYRVIIIAIWGKVCLYKYISCWLLTEGVCIMSGLTYNGKDAKGHNKWDGCANVKLRVFENATRFGHLIESFNINTNHWVAEYVYKRLKFLGNRTLSQALTLFFLAVWHGLHIGYYVCFFMEFIIMTFEKDVEKLMAKNPTIGYLLTDAKLAPVRWVIGKLYVFMFMGYCLAPFALFSHYWAIYRSLYFMGFVFFLGWIALSPVVMPRLIRSSRARPDVQPSSSLSDPSDSRQKVE